MHERGVELYTFKMIFGKLRMNPIIWFMICEKTCALIMR